MTEDYEKMLLDALAFFQSHSGPLEPWMEDILLIIYGEICIAPDSPPFSPAQWGFMQFSNALDDRELMEGMVDLIPGGQAELERALARPRRHLTNAADVVRVDLLPS